jgi:hypothetical protein
MKPESNSESSPLRERRSSRVLVSIPLLISGKRENGKRFEGSADAVIVNKHGGKIRTSEQLSSGMQIRIAIVSPYRFQMARVVREEAAGEFSIELQEAENLWGVYFPPDDWEIDASQTLTSPTEPSNPTISLPEQKRTDQAPVPGSSETSSNASSPIAHHGIGSPESSSTASPLPLPRDGSAAVIRGMSALRMPFQERCVLVPMDDRHARIAIQQLVESGTKARIIFLPSERVENAVIVGMSRTRYQGKWIVELKFETLLCIN